MMPVALALMLGAAVLAGAAILLLAIRSKRRQPQSNIVDLASARRRKLREAALKSASEEIPKIKRPLAPPSGAEIRKFVPKTGDGRLHACSRCQKKSDSVGFYVNDYGHLVGVCKECRKSAKNRDLMPL